MHLHLEAQTRRSATNTRGRQNVQSSLESCLDSLNLCPASLLSTTLQPPLQLSFLLFRHNKVISTSGHLHLLLPLPELLFPQIITSSFS